MNRLFLLTAAFLVGAYAAGAGPGDDYKWSLSVGTAAISPNGNRVLVGYHDGNAGIYASIWDVNERKRLHFPAITESNLQFCAFLPDGNHIVLVSQDGMVALRHANDGFAEGATIKTVRSFRAYAVVLWKANLSADGNYLITAGTDDEAWTKTWPPPVSIRVWDLRTGILKRGLTTVCSCVPYLAISPSGKLAVTGDVDLLPREPRGRITLWDVETGAILKEFEEKNGWGLPAAFSPDGNGLVVGRLADRTRWDGDFRYWDLKSLKETKFMRAAPLGVLQGLPGDRWASIIGDKDGPQVRMWTFAAPDSFKDISISGAYLATALSVSADGKFALTTSGSRGTGIRGSLVVYVWNLQTGKRWTDWEDTTNPGDFRLPGGAVRPLR